MHRSLSPWLSPTKPAFTRSAETLSTKVTQEKAVILNSAATKTPTNYYKLHIECHAGSLELYVFDLTSSNHTMTHNLIYCVKLSLSYLRQFKMPYNELSHLPYSVLNYVTLPFIKIPYRTWLNQ